MFGGYTPESDMPAYDTKVLLRFNSVSRVKGTYIHMHRIYSSIDAQIKAADICIFDFERSLLSKLDEYTWTLPESGLLPSARRFAECFLSGTRQKNICRVSHSAKSCSR
jgi:hypothetical protein